jgi:hypothetical protein
MTTQGKSLQLIDRNTIAQPDRRYWGVRADMGSELRYMYSIGLLDLGRNFTAVEVKGADPAFDYKGRGAPWFTFPTPPSQYEITEPASTTIVPTQDGGKFIESQGSIFKDIRIAGTVGLRPAPVGNELVPGLSKATGVSLNIPSTVADLWVNDERGLRTDEITGLDDITFLRNIFRGYWDFKKRDEYAGRIVMVWMYAKESEWYIVEPIGFTTTRDSSNPLSWNYNIQLRTLYRFDVALSLVRDPVGFFQSMGNAWKSVNQAIRDIAAAINQITNAVNVALQLPFNVISDLLGSVNSVLSSLVNLVGISGSIDTLKRTTLRNIDKQLEQARSLARQIENGKASGFGKGVFGGVNSPTGGEVPPTDDAALSIHRNIFIRQTIILSRVIKNIHAQDSLFETPKQLQVNDYGSRYLVNGEPQFTSGSPLNPSNITIPGSATEVEVSGDIRSMAKQYLGDEAFWKLLVILNGLKYPYISPERGDGVLSPGDKMMIPKRPDEDDVKETAQDTLTDAEKEALSPTVKKYGRDLKLNDSSFGTDFADVSVSQKGDLDVIDGIPNVNQAMMVKFSTEQGELPTHPQFGAKYPTGTKLLLGRIQEFAINTKRTILSDSRVESVDRIRIYANGDVLNVAARARLKQTDSKIPVEFSVRRA